MARVAWHLDGVVLDHVLLHDGVASLESRCLHHSGGVEIRLWNETIVSWDVGGGLGGSYR